LHLSEFLVSLHFRAVWLVTRQTDIPRKYMHAYTKTRGNQYMTGLRSPRLAAPRDLGGRAGALALAACRVGVRLSCLTRFLALGEHAAALAAKWAPPASRAYRRPGTAPAPRRGSPRRSAARPEIDIQIHSACVLAPSRGRRCSPQVAGRSWSRQQFWRQLKRRRWRRTRAHRAHSPCWGRASHRRGRYSPPR